MARNQATKLYASIVCGFLPLAWAAGQQPIKLDQAVQTAISTRSSIRAQIEKLRAAESSERAVPIEPPLRTEFGYGTRPELGIGNDFLVAVPIDLFGKNAAERSVARAEVRSARAALAQAEVDLQSEVFSSFSELLSGQEELESAKVVENLAEQSYQATKKRIDSGDLAPSQLLKADLELRRAKQTLLTAESNVSSARVTFAAVIGVPVDTLQSLDAAAFDLPALGNEDHRPDIEAARAAAASAFAEKGVARSSTAPDFEFQLAHDYWDTSGRVTARAQLVWNFFDYGASANRHDAAFHSTRSAELSVQDLLAQAHAQTSSSKTAYEAARQEYASYQSLADDAKSILEKEQRAFTLGGNTLLDVMEASRSYREILGEATQARARLIVAQAKLLSATGTLVAAVPQGAKP